MRRTRPGPVLLIVLSMALVAACSGSAPNGTSPGVASTSPTATSAPSVATGALATSAAASPTATTGKPSCMEAAAYTLLNTIKGDAALLQQHRDELVAALNAFQPPAKFDASWRDKLVADLTANDYQGAIQQLGLLGVEAFITSC
jgi:hypothetical protein